MGGAEPLGSADERTALAWSRSWVGAATCLAVLLRHLTPLGSGGLEATLVVVSAVTALCALGAFVVTTRRASRDPSPILGERACWLLGTGTAALAGVAIVLVLLAPP